TAMTLATTTRAREDIVSSHSRMDSISEKARIVKRASHLPRIHHASAAKIAASSSGCGHMSRVSSWSTSHAMTVLMNSKSQSTLSVSQSTAESIHSPTGIRGRSGMRAPFRGSVDAVRGGERREQGDPRDDAQQALLLVDHRQRDGALRGGCEQLDERGVGLHPREVLQDDVLDRGAAARGVRRRVVEHRAAQAALGT